MIRIKFCYICQNYGYTSSTCQITTFSRTSLKCHNPGNCEEEQNKEKRKKVVAADEEEEEEEEEREEKEEEEVEQAERKEDVKA